MQIGEKYQPGEHLRVYYGPNETGWVEYVKEGIVRTLNTSINGSPSIGDEYELVELKDDEEGLPYLGELLKEKYAAVSCLYYTDVEDFKKVARMLEDKYDCAVEGWCAPKDDKPGICSVAHHEHIDPASAANTMELNGKVWKAE